MDPAPYQRILKKIERGILIATLLILLLGLCLYITCTIQTSRPPEELFRMLLQDPIPRGVKIIAGEYTPQWSESHGLILFECDDTAFREILQKFPYRQEGEHLGTNFDEIALQPAKRAFPGQELVPDQVWIHDEGTFFRCLLRNSKSGKTLFRFFGI